MNDRESLCGKYFVPLKRVSPGKVEYSIVPVLCGSWECLTCRQRKAALYLARIKKMFDGRPLWMLTLTYFHDHVPEQMWKEYNYAWNRLKTNLVKQSGKFSFVRVLESHTNSPYPHLHIILDKNIKPTVLNKAVLSAGFGYQMELKKVTGTRAAEYVTKYLTKGWRNAESISIVKKSPVRRISFSRDLAVEPESRQKWELLGLPTERKNAEECIDVDRSFDTGHRYVERDRIVRDNFYLIEYDTEDLPAGLFRRKDLDDWEPDDWSPV